MTAEAPRADTGQTETPQKDVTKATGATTTPPATTIPEEAKITRVPGVQLNVAPGKEVIIRIPGREQSYRGKIVGLDPYDFVIVKVRLPSAIRKELKFGGDVVIKYVHQGTIYGFKAMVHNAISSPAPLLFFEYPDVLEKLDLRKTQRTKCNIDGMLHTTNDEAECMIINVSELGCKISARAGGRNALKDINVDDALIVAMNLGSSGELKVAIAVKNISLDKGIISLGCMFLDISKEELATILKYLEKINRLVV
jgi:hypothetical protein